MATIQFRRWQVLAGLMIAIAGPALAQTSTPTPTPPAATPTPTFTCAGPRAATCVGAKKLNVAWFAKDPFTVRMAISATGCPAVPECDLAVDGELVTIPPLSVELKDANGLTFAKTVTDPGVNLGGCPGSELYRGISRLKFVYGAGGVTTVLGKFRFAQTQSMPPTLTPPITVTISDACGVVDSVTMNTCYPRFKDTTSSLKCF